MTFIVSNLIKDVLKAHQIERYQAFVLSWRFQGVPPPPPHPFRRRFDKYIILIPIEAQTAVFSSRV